MSLPTIHSSALRYLALAAFAVCSFGVSQQATATEVVPLSLTETARQAQTIVVGTVVSQQTRWGTDAKRWMLTDYTIAVEEVIATDGRAQPSGDRMIVTYWGGTIGSETHGISDRREPRVGERLLLMLQQDWQTTVTASPAVGFNYGLFVVAAGEGDETAIVRDAHGKPLARSDDGRLAWRTGDAPAGTSDTIDLASFIKWLRESLPSIKASPSEIPPPADPNDPRVLKTYSHAPAFMPAQPRHDERSAFPAGPLQPHLLDRSTQAPQPDYVTFGRANIPITVNNFQSTFTPWAPEDQIQMSNWNYYVDIFRVRTSPTGTFGWNDNVFDLCGFPNSATLQSVYGSGWGPTELGVTFFRLTNGVIVEADIALNPAASWTLDNEWVYNGGAARCFRRTMTHELGHMFGLNHEFNANSVMNYTPDWARAFNFPYLDDVLGARSLYPAAALSRTDLGVFLHYASGYQSTTDTPLPATVTAGSSFTINNYHVENVGTTSIATPSIQWYLTPARNFNTSYFLGTATYSSLSAGTALSPSSVSRTIPVPATVPAGTYYLAAFIPSDGGPGQGTFPFSNNHAFSKTTMQVTAPVGSLQVTISPAGAVSAGAQWQVDGGAFQNSGATVSNLSVGNHTVSFKPVSGWTTPSSQTITVSANNTSTTSGTYVAVPQTGSLQVTIAPAGAISAGAQWQVNGGAFQNSGATVSGLSVGTHTVAFKSVPGWSTPSNQTISVTANTTSSTTGTYTAVPSTGSLQVSIFPAAAANGGAQWQVNGGAFQNSGATVSGLSVGNHTVSFKPLSGWTTPSDQIISVSANTTSSTTGSYIAPPLQFLGASSTKTHGASGTFGINLPLTGTPGVESRTGGAGGNHTLIFTFSNNLTGGSAAVTSGVGSISGAPSFAGNTLIVQLTGVSNAQRVTVNLSNMTDNYGQVLQSTPLTVSFLVGDTNGSGNVNATDIGQTKAGSGQTVSASNFRQDVNVSGGSINASDVGLVKAAAGSQLPPL